MKTSAKIKSIVATPKKRKAVGERKTARLFTNGASQAVRLPKEFRMEGTEVRIWKEGERVVLEPVKKSFSWDAWADALAKFDGKFMPEGRQQPPMPSSKISFDE